MENLEIQKNVFAPFGELVARSLAEELEVKGGLLQPKDLYIKQKTEDIVSAIETELSKREKNLNRAAAALHEKLFLLPRIQREKIEKEMIGAEGKVVDILAPKEEIRKEDTFQSLLGLSNDTLLWIYSIGYQLFEDGKKEDAFAIFQMLTTLNPLVADYWIAEGLTQKALNYDMESLHSFAMASIMKPNNPIPRCQSVEIYLKIGQIDSARLEFAALEKIMQSAAYPELGPFVDLLRNKIQFSKAS